MRRTAALVAVTLGALAAAAGTPAQSDPGRMEKLRLTAADNALARAIAVRRADLGAGWTVDPRPAPKREPVSCPGYDPDFSRSTVTGLGYSAFLHQAGAAVVSAVEVYPSRAQAAGDFQTGMRPGVLGCLRKVVQDSVAESTPGSVTARVASARAVTAPRVGERRAQFRIVIRMSGNGSALNLVADVLVVQRGRSLATLMFMSVAEPLRGQVPLARAVVARMR